MTDRERFDSKWELDAQTGCWLWSAARDKNGYGFFKMGGKQYRAHRLAVVFDGRELPPGTQALHTCNRPPCVNPEHLYVGTPLNNMQDRMAAGRYPVGEEHPRATLTDEVVRRIRALKDSGERQVDVASLFGTCQSQVSAIWRGEVRTEAVG